MERTCSRFVLFLISHHWIHLSSLLRSVTSCLISRSETNVSLMFPRIQIYYPQQELRIFFHATSKCSWNENLHLPQQPTATHPRALRREKSLQTFSRAFPSLTHATLSNRFISFSSISSPRSPPLSRKMSWMKMCFMSYYTILLFSISKFHSVFIWSWNEQVRNFQFALAKKYLAKDYFNVIFTHHSWIYAEFMLDFYTKNILHFGLHNNWKD